MGSRLFFCLSLQTHLDPCSTQSLSFDHTVQFSFSDPSLHWTFTLDLTTARMLFLPYLFERQVDYHPLVIDLTGSQKDLHNHGI